MGRKGEPIQAYFRDIVGSVPDHCNKASIPIKGGVIFLLVLPSICKKNALLVKHKKCNKMRYAYTQNMCQSQSEVMESNVPNLPASG